MRSFWPVAPTRVLARPNGSVTVMVRGPMEYTPRCRQVNEYEAFCSWPGGMPVTTSLAGLPIDAGTASSRSRNGRVARPSLRTASVATTRVPGKTRTADSDRWTVTLTWPHRTSASETKGRANTPAATMCRSGEPMNRAATHRNRPVPKAAHPRLVGMDATRDPGREPEPVP